MHMFYYLVSSLFYESKNKTKIDKIKHKTLNLSFKNVSIYLNGENKTQKQIKMNMIRMNN